MYKIINHLRFIDSNETEYNFIGCQAEIVGETSSYFEVVFYSSIPFLINKQDFILSSIETEEKIMKHHYVYDVFIIKNGVKNKALRTILFAGDDIIYKSKEIVFKLLKLSDGVDYDSISTVLVSEQGTKQILNSNNNTEMAKQKVAETGLTAFQEQAEKITLPAIPKVMTIGGLEFSEDKIRAEVEEVKKLQVEIPLPTDTMEEVQRKTKLYEVIKEKKNQFVKTRTAPDSFRKELVKPLAAWQKELKDQTDSYGNIAKEGQDHCEAQLLIYDNWHEEQERIEKEATEARVKERSQLLSDIEGVKNFESGHWTFPYAPHLLVEADILEAEDRKEWEDALSELNEEYAKHKENKARESKQLADSQRAIVDARTMILNLSGYQSFGTSFVKNGHTFTLEMIANLSVDDFNSVMTKHNTPIANVSTENMNVDETPRENVNPFANPFENSPFSNPNPFSTTESSIISDSDEHQNDMVVEEQIVTEWSVDNPFFEFDLSKTVLRIFHPSFESQALDYPDRDNKVAYSGSKGNISFVIFKK